MKELMLLATITLLAFSPVLEADAASKKPGSRSDYTKEQQKKFFDEALKLCRKKYKTQLHFVRVNYKKKQYVCCHY